MVTLGVLEQQVGKSGSDSHESRWLHLSDSLNSPSEKGGSNQEADVAGSRFSPFQSISLVFELR